MESEKFYQEMVETNQSVNRRISHQSHQKQTNTMKGNYSYDTITQTNNTLHDTDHLPPDDLDNSNLLSTGASGIKFISLNPLKSLSVDNDSSDDSDSDSTNLQSPRNEKQKLLSSQNESAMDPRRLKSMRYYGNTESQQYEQDENEVWKHHQLQRQFQDKNQWWSYTDKREWQRWMLTLITGFVCGLVAIFVAVFTKFITSWKFDVFYQLIDNEKNGSSFYGLGFIFLITVNLILGTLAYLTVYIEPLAAGSGIPEIKCYLNGLNIPRLVRVKTLICKVLGIIFSCSSGLPLGKEGPMVHAGSVVAAGVCQGKSNVIGCDTSFTKFQDFRNDREKRDFVACGAAVSINNIKI